MSDLKQQSFSQESMYTAKMLQTLYKLLRASMSLKTKHRCVCIY